jgi:hypothetical protein
MENTKITQSNHSLTLEQRRAFMKLPLEERRRRMAEQAARMIDHYESHAEAIERQAWQGGDVIE